MAKLLEVMGGIGDGLQTVAVGLGGGLQKASRMSVVDIMVIF
jgi:hypothetical protein